MSDHREIHPKDLKPGMLVTSFQFSVPRRILLLRENEEEGYWVVLCTTYYDVAELTETRIMKWTFLYGRYCYVVFEKESPCS